jgi:hypothetical protein
MILVVIIALSLFGVCLALYFDLCEAEKRLKDREDK